MNFMEQRDGYRCGPIAIVNSMIWSGKPFTLRTRRKELVRLARACNATRRTRGTRMVTMMDVLRLEGITTRTVMPMTVPHLQGTLRDNKGVIMTVPVDYAYTDEDGERHIFTDAHYVFISGITKGGHYAYVTNWCNLTRRGWSAPRHMRVSMRKLAKFLRHPTAACFIIDKVQQQQLATPIQLVIDENVPAQETGEAV